MKTGHIPAFAALLTSVVSAVVLYPGVSHATLPGPETFPGSNCIRGTVPYSWVCPFVAVEQGTVGPGAPGGTSAENVSNIYVDVRNTSTQSVTAESCWFAYNGTAVVCGNQSTFSFTGWHEFNLGAGFANLGSGDYWWDYFYVQVNGSTTTNINGIGYY